MGTDLLFERDPTFAKSGQIWGTLRLKSKMGAPLRHVYEIFQRDAGAFVGQ